MNRSKLADLIVESMPPRLGSLQGSWAGSGAVSHCVIDNLLPPAVAQDIFEAFLHAGEMTLKSSLQERKLVAAQMNRCQPLGEDAVFAFQDPQIVAMVGEITGLDALEPDAKLYAGGISMMSRGHFLNPHVDNSHDKDRKRYRVLNLLYYTHPRACGPMAATLSCGRKARGAPPSPSSAASIGS
jgi:Rps23 Pro-64 3,4-dihydroxylase Tpa1-like proline 4-hydroxylase